MAQHGFRRMGLARALSKKGWCSRSRAAELIREGRVLLNGCRPRGPETAVDLARDELVVDGMKVAAAPPVYLMLNKPRGVVTTASDEKGRKTVLDLVPVGQGWIAPVGRLDKASEGLLLLTNDSEWGARILDPATHVPKTYHVQIAAHPSAELLDWIRGRRAGTSGAERVAVIREGRKNCWLEIVLNEGKNRQIRRMFEEKHIEVRRLVRIAIGPLELRDLPKGKHRALSVTEKRVLEAAARAHGRR